MKPIALDERYKLFQELNPEMMGCNQIGPSPAYEAGTGEFLGYVVGLYWGHIIRQRLTTEPFPLEQWEEKLTEALKQLYPEGHPELSASH